MPNTNVLPNVSSVRMYWEYGVFQISLDFNVHNSYHENLINYMAPLDIPVEDLEQDFNGVNAHVIDGKVYYIDYGMMTGSVYYNKEMWKEAVLTDDDIPKTWDEMIEVAKKLTIKDGDIRRRRGQARHSRAVGVPDCTERVITSSPQIDHKHPGPAPRTPA